MGGHVTAVFADYPTVVGHLQNGTLRGLVTASAKRNPALPDVPTFAETGVTPYDADIFYGIVAPTKTPPEALKQLSDWFGAALRAPEVQPRLAQLWNELSTGDEPYTSVVVPSLTLDQGEL